MFNKNNAGSILQTLANGAYFRKTKLSLDYTNKRLEVVQDGIENLPKFYFLSSEKPVDISRSEDLSVDVKEIDGVRIPAPLGRMLLEWK